MSASVSLRGLGRVVRGLNVSAAGRMAASAGVAVLRAGRAGGGRRSRGQVARSVNALMEAVEDRRLLSAALPVTITHSSNGGLFTGELTNATPANAGANGQLDRSSPSIAYDPLDPNKQVVVYTERNDNPSGGVVQTVSTRAMYTTDGGVTWKTAGFSVPGNQIDPATLSSTGTGGSVFPLATDASVAFDRTGKFYILYAERTSDNNEGQLVLQGYDFTGSTPSQVLTNSRVYYWQGHDPALKPTLAVDANPATFTDPTTGDTQDDPASGSIYVAWATDDTLQPVNGQAPNPNSIRVTASGDGGATFANSIYVNDTAKVVGTTERATAPKLVVSDGTASGSIAPGSVGILWDDVDTTARDGNNNPLDIIRFDKSTNGFTVASQTFLGGNIADAIAGTPNVMTTTTFSGNVSLPGAFTALNPPTEMSVKLSFTSVSLTQHHIFLVAPNGLGTVNLLLNQVDVNGTVIDPPGTATTQGLTGTTLGILNTQTLGLSFADNAPDNIHNGIAPYLGVYKPESGQFSSILAAAAANPALLNGTWQLKVEDYRNDGTAAPATLGSWTLSFSHLQTGSDVEVARTRVRGSIANANYGLASAATPNGIGPGAVIASDNTLGSFSLHQGRLYVAYTDRYTQDGNPTDNTDIYMKVSDNFGASWTNPASGANSVLGAQLVNDDNALTDGFSEAHMFGDVVSQAPNENGIARAITGRPQFDPAIAVDPLTGTVAVSFYDARNDASRARVATYLGVSLDGGATFGGATSVNRDGVSSTGGGETFLNVGNTSTDGITGQKVTYGPVPDNQSSGNNRTESTFGFGSGQGLAFVGGRIMPVWSGNLNGLLTGQVDPASNRLLTVLTARVTVPAGPRVVSSTMGPVAGTGFSSFTVTFDRPVDATTFHTGDIDVRYRNDTTPGTDPGTPVAVASISPSTGTSTSFTVTLSAAQSAVGTYTYSILPNLTDAIRSETPLGVVVSGNRMDQNGDAVGGNAGSDTYSVPAGNADTATMPIIVPGPRVVSTHVNGQPVTTDNLVLDQPVSDIDVTFDRAIDPATFTPGSIVRMVGPAGLITGTFTVSQVNATTFRVGFPAAQQLNGTYTIILSSSIKDTNGNALDTDQNAGLFSLRGISSSTTPVTFTSSPAATIGSATGVAVTTSTITVPAGQNFQISKLTLGLNVTYPQDTDLQAYLIPPNADPNNSATWIQLFANIGNNGSRANFTNTLFDDTATTAVTDANAPFFGTFKPQTNLITFPRTLTDQIGQSAAGTWTLRIVDTAPTATTGKLNSWTLNFQKPVPTASLGEAVADQATVSFRVFNGAAGDAEAGAQWTSITGANNSGRGAGAISDLAVDPSDPSGNTVYAGAQSGGIWKTTNFLTTDAAGPTWVPLTDFGPAFGYNISSIAVFGRNGDPNQSVIFATTGSGDASTPGVGILRSLDGGATWNLLTNSVNANASGALIPVSQRSGTSFVSGMTSFKIAVDPKATPTGDVIVYAAMVDQNAFYDSFTGAVHDRGGIWRSVDSGRTWQQMKVGAPTDFVLDPASGIVDAFTNPTGNLQSAYAGFKQQSLPDHPSGPGTNPPPQANRIVNGGVFSTPNRGQSWTLMAGGVGDPLIQANGPTIPLTPLTVQAPPSTPNGAVGRIVLAKPALTGNVNQDAIYEGWLYALVITPAQAGNPTSGTFQGLYLTKDFGQNWTKVRVSAAQDTQGLNSAIPTNDANRPDYDVFAGGFIPAGRGGYDVSLAVDPNNPNVVYVGGTSYVNSISYTATGMLRIDATHVADAHAFFQNDGANDGGATQANVTDGTAYNANNVTFALPDVASLYNSPVTNLIHNPAFPFNAGSTVVVRRANPGSGFSNSGSGASWTPVFDSTLTPPQGGSLGLIGTGTHRILAIKDPVTGATRLLFANDNGISTGVDDGTGKLLTGIGSAAAVSGSRNGNIQTEQFFYGAVQPSAAAANAGGALTLGGSLNGGVVTTDPNVLTNGNTAGNGRFDNAGGLATDPQGSGTTYQYLLPLQGPDSRFGLRLPTDFFQVNGVGRTFGLLQTTGGGNLTRDPQWPDQIPLNFNVNPVNGQQILISSARDATSPNAGPFATVTNIPSNIFTTVDQGRHWTVIAAPGDLVGTRIDFDQQGNPVASPVVDDSYAGALAYGAPDPNGPAGPDTTNFYILAGTTDGRIFVSFNGGGTTGSGNRWTDITAGLPVNANNIPTAAVQQIVTDPRRGSYDAYAITTAGVFYNPDTRSASWQDVTGNLKALTRAPFGDALLDAGGLTPAVGTLNAIAADWRYAFPNSLANPNGATHPILYVAGNGGVFRSLGPDASGKWQWAAFPDGAPDVNPAIPAGGLMPSTNVTDLDLALGNVDPSTGFPDAVAGDPNVLVASTYGRGQFAIRMAPVILPSSVSLISGAVSGYSAVTAFKNTTQVKIFDMTTPSSPVQIGTGTTDASGHFVITVTGLSGTGAHAIGVQATDDAGVVSGIQTFMLTDATALPVNLTGKTFAATVNQTLTTVIATFTDPAGVGPLAGYAVTVNWGDGTPVDTAAVLSVDPQTGVVSITGTHTYATTGAFNVTVSVTRGTAPTATVTSHANVALAQPVDISPAAQVNATEGTPVTAVVATFTEPAGVIPPGSYTISVDWGDGTAAGTGTATYDAQTGVYTVTATHTFLIAGDFSAVVTVQRGLAAPASATTPVKVADIPLVGTGGFQYVGSEGTGDPAQTVATFTDPGGVVDPNTHYAAQVDWGDGSAASAGAITYDGGTGVFTVKGAHVYGDSGSYVVTVTISHDVAPDTVVTSTATIAETNVTGGAPKTFAASKGIAFSGVIATFTHPNTTPEPAGQFTATIAWGDGGSGIGTVIYDAVTATYSVIGSYVYTVPGTYTATVTVHNTKLAAGVNRAITATANVANTTVTLTGGLVYAATEGNLGSVQTVAVFRDPGGQDPVASYTATINWGDGTPVVAGTVVFDASTGQFQVRGQHQYNVTGTDTITVVVNHVSNGIAAAPAQATSTANVAGAPIVVHAVPITAVEGTPFSGVIATLTDTSNAPPDASHFTATVNWGEGAGAEAATVVYDAAAGHYDVVSSHTFADGDTVRAVTVQVQDNDGANDAASETVPVANVAPAAHITGSPTRLGGAATFTVGATDPSGADTGAGFKYVIDWGDGSNPTVILPTAGNGAGQQVQHVFTNDGAFNVVLTVTDKDGGSSTATITSQGPAATGVVPVVTTTVNGGSSDRSTVTSVDVVLSNGTNPLPPLTLADLTLVRDGGQAVSLNGATFTFDPATGALHLGLAGVALPDGDYQVQVNMGAAGVVPLTFSKLTGDVDGDGVVTNKDVNAVKAAVGSGDLSKDVNGDGVVDAADLKLVKASKGHRTAPIVKTVTLKPGKALSKPTLTFKSVKHGQNVAPIDLVIRNTDATQPLLLQGLKVAGDTKGAFAVALKTGSVWGQTPGVVSVDPGQSVTIRVYVTATAKGSYGAKLNFGFGRSSQTLFTSAVLPLKAKLS